MTKGAKPCRLYAYSWLVLQCFLEIIKYFFHFFLAFVFVGFLINFIQSVKNETNKRFELAVGLSHIFTTLQNSRYL